MLILKTAILGALGKVASVVYGLAKLFPTQDKVTFVSRGQRFTSIDFRLVSDQVKRVSPSTRVVILNHPVDPKLVYPFKVVVEMFHIATSRAVVIDTYNIVVSLFRHKSSLRTVQIWHALGAFKAFGLLAVGKDEGSSAQIANVMHMHRNYSFVTVASRATAETFQQCFGVTPAQTAIVGSPRVDYLLDVPGQAVQRERLRTKYGIATDKQVVLFAPTFRKGRAIPLDQLVAEFDFDKFALVFRGHPLDRLTAITDSRVIIPDENEGIELLAFADHVVTDYSAIAFEASLLTIPLHFWAFDLDEYSVKRGLVVDLADVAPSPVLTSASDVVAAIAGGHLDRVAYDRFRSTFIETADSNNSERIANLVLGNA